MSTSLSDVLIGVAVAIIAFVAQQLVSFVFDGINFRRRLAADIGLIVDGFRTWDRPADVVLQKDADPTHPAISMALIWDYSYESIDDLYIHSAHLHAELFPRVARFYSAAGRFDEIRHSYNTAILETVKSSEKVKWAVVLNCHIKDLTKVAEEIVTSGDEVLSALAKRYAFEHSLQELATTKSDVA
jgi:hypothetical protein